MLPVSIAQDESADDVSTASGSIESMKCLIYLNHAAVHFKRRSFIEPTTSARRTLVDQLGGYSP